LKRVSPFLTALPIAAATLTASPILAQWEAAEAPVMTRWAEDVSAENVHAEYPRPQLTRDEWQTLNGLWDYSIAPRNALRPTDWLSGILVPFPVESALSGVMERIDADHRLWYRRTFTLPASWLDKRVLLHFGAVDWEATIWVNGRPAGDHRGGYDPFTLDITSALEPGSQQEIVVAVWDPTSSGYQPRGKQVNDPRGIWYTPSTGIWRSVWLEPVPEVSIDHLRLVPDIDRERMMVSAMVPAARDHDTIEVLTLDGTRIVSRAGGRVNTMIELEIPDARLWSPDAPFLYDLKVTLLRDGAAVDEVGSYFGMRKISLDRDADGILRMMLNNEFHFQIGPLDQGFWPDGLYTAPSDEALRYDIEVTRDLGFNMARKHVKIEPDRWYYWCDRLGLLVWQDMPSGDRYIGGEDPDIERTAQSARQFELEFRRNIDALSNHPSIVTWVIFNEGWGQYDTGRLTDWIGEYDPTRLVISASGWTDRGTGDVHDIHSYPGPAAPAASDERAIVLGEFGGLGFPVKGHLWQSDRNWGYRNFESAEDLAAAYESLLRRLHRLIADPGLSAAVYTQTSDVETEVNGLMTYDRAVTKMEVDRVAAANRRLDLPPPEITAVVTDARREPHRWRYTTDEPPAEWAAPRFDDGSWPEGEAGFGREDTPGAIVRTSWESDDIWIRRRFDLPDGNTEDLYLAIHHDENAEIWINGIPAASLSGYTTAYVEEPISEEARATLRRRGNVIAIHCHQTGGGQYIDAGLVRIRER